MWKSHFALCVFILFDGLPVYAAAVTGGNTTVTLTSGSAFVNADDISTACGDNPGTVVIQAASVSGTTPLILPGNSAHMWWSSLDNACGDLPSEYKATEEWDLTDTTMIFPTGFSTVESFTQADIVAALTEDDSFCETFSETTTQAFNSTQKLACLAVIQPTPELGTENTAERKVSDISLDFLGWVQMELDTQVPPTPETPSVLSLDQGVELTPNISSSGESDDIVSWVVRYQSVDTAEISQEHTGTLSSTETSTDEDCTSWSSDNYSEVIIEITSLEANFRVDGLDNTLSYAMCMAAQDNADNVGAFSYVFEVTPQNECDFIECFPGTPPSGHCTSVGSSTLWMVLMTCLLVSIRRSSLKW
jgi:hypothetical protein